MCDLSSGSTCWHITFLIGTKTGCNYDGISSAHRYTHTHRCTGTHIWSRNEEVWVENFYCPQVNNKTALKAPDLPQWITHSIPTTCLCNQKLKTQLNTRLIIIKVCENKNGFCFTRRKIFALLSKTNKGLLKQPFFNYSVRLCFLLQADVPQNYILL